MSQKVVVPANGAVQAKSRSVLAVHGKVASATAEGRFSWGASDMTYAKVDSETTYFFNPFAMPS